MCIRDRFQKLFEVILTDNGHEFQDRQSLEYSKNGEEMCIRDSMRFYALLQGLLPPAKTFPLPEGVLKVHG